MSNQQRTPPNAGQPSTPWQSIGANIFQSLSGRQASGTGNSPPGNNPPGPMLSGGNSPVLQGQALSGGNSPILQGQPGNAPFSQGYTVSGGNSPVLQGPMLSGGSSPVLAQPSYSSPPAPPVAPIMSGGSSPVLPQPPYSSPPPPAPIISGGSSPILPQPPFLASISSGGQSPVGGAPSRVQLPSVVQAPSKGRTIILCFDGTGNKFGKENSNVVRFMSALEKNDPDKQIIYYQPGIGTYTSKKFITQSFTWFYSTIDAAFARNLSGHVMDGYKFLMKNYRPGDKICLFGFSRGAYTARALSGMIYKVGLLLPDNNEQLEFPYQIYSSTDLETSMVAREFKKTFSLSVQTYFLGVWDTVASVGIIPQSLPYATQNDGVIHFRHALALDERRARFRPNLWGEPIAEREELDTVPQLNQIPMSDDAYVYHPPRITDVQEVWFAGAHADVGGGSHPTWYSTSLSRIPLRWMIRECFLTKTGILFNEERLKESADLKLVDLQGASGKLVPIHNIHPNRYVMGRSWFRKMPISDNMMDVLSDIFDQLSIFLAWWIIELLPLIWTFQKGDGTWSRWRRRNFGNGRYLPHHNEQILVHESVRDRILNPKTKYWPKAINWDNVKDHIEWQR